MITGHSMIPIPLDPKHIKKLFTVGFADGNPDTMKGDFTWKNVVNQIHINAETAMDPNKTGGIQLFHKIVDG